MYSFTISIMHSNLFIPTLLFLFPWTGPANPWSLISGPDITTTTRSSSGSGRPSADSTTNAGWGCSSSWRARPRSPTRASRPSGAPTGPGSSASKNGGSLQVCQGWWLSCDPQFPPEPRAHSRTHLVNKAFSLPTIWALAVNLNHMHSFTTQVEEWWQSNESVVKSLKTKKTGAYQFLYLDYFTWNCWEFLTWTRSYQKNLRRITHLTVPLIYLA